MANCKLLCTPAAAVRQVFPVEGSVWQPQYVLFEGAAAEHDDCPQCKEPLSDLPWVQLAVT